MVYPRAQIERLPELQQLQADPRFERLLRARNDKPRKDIAPDQ